MVTPAPGSRRTLRDSRPGRTTAGAIAERAIQRAIVRERAAKVRACGEAWAAWQRREDLWREHFRPYRNEEL